MNKKIVLFLLIILIACFLRIYNLSSVPPSASLDEATIGWNAYSILETGKDEYGYKLPMLLRAYDDYRPALYVYLVVPFIKLFGLNVFAVRMSSVLLSISTIILSFFLAKTLFKDSKIGKSIGFITAFLLAISPWNIYISRLGHEANAGLFLVVLGIFLFTLSIKDKKRKWLLPLSLISFAISFYTYQSEKIFAPLIFIALMTIFRRELLKMKKIVFYSFILGIIVALPIIVASLSPQALIRFKATSAFDYNNQIFQKSAIKIVEDKKKGDIVGQIIHNRRVVAIQFSLSQYISHLNPKWIFLNSGTDSFKAPGVGLLYLWESPFILVGILSLIKNKFSNKTKAIIFSWLGIAFIAPAITTEAPHAMRSLNVFPVPQILTALGVFELARLIKFKIFYLLFGAVVLFESFYFFNQYFYIFPKEQSSSFQYALSKTIPYVLSQQKNYQKVVISNSDNLYQSYMFYLFYSKYDPKLYQKQGGTISGGYAENHKFDNLFFEPINFKEDSGSKGTLYVGNPNEFSKNISPIKTFRNLNGEEAIIVVAK
ncbi:MAG: glycosyltransferase family 39 protein [Patescibacteria group bacterium]